ncbi:MAG: class I SAM-dependent rRNA methyltransferase [candidate division Zixibacteria bacterium]|nr:class I SAM-dependent rRNA methyltransferase [candidate division Zixibacteria bacterium]
MYPQLRLKQNRTASLANRHPWVFSGALEQIPNGLTDGDLVSIVDGAGTTAAVGTYAAHSLISVRIFHFGPAEIDKAWIGKRIAEAHRRRLLLGFGAPDLTGYRVVFGESDLLPGIVIDRYGDVFVVQLATTGAERFRQAIVDCLVEQFSPVAVYERSDLPSRDEERLPAVTGLLYGRMPETVEFREYGRVCIADVAGGQKTGFFLDQRDLRQEVARIAAGRRAVDLFSNMGACALAALSGGAASVHCVDSSEHALTQCANHAVINGLDSSRLTTETADVFQWIAARSAPEYDLIMLDPPALIKSRRHYEAGRKGYHFLNRAALRLLNDGGILVTSSCSAFFTEEDLAVTLRRGADQAEVELSLLKTIRQSPDHPLSFHFPEAAYLKAFVCLVSR